MTGDGGSPIFHIATVADWKAAQDLGRYEVDSLGAEGFISTLR